MTIKGWVLRKVNPTIKPGEDDRGRGAPTLRGAADAAGDTREPGLRAGRDTAHLGRYAPLVSAIRSALEDFVASELRLHLAIAERDRYVLTSIDVECEDSEEHQELLRRFMHEFKPEQIKQYLARDVIAGLRNASAIDLTQFAGLNADREAAPEDDPDDPYRELVAQLQSGAEATTMQPYRVTIVGRWSEDAGRAARSVTHAPARDPQASPSPHTPLAARAFALDVHDANGARRVELEAVAAGRRYVVGKDETCDIVTDGVYASRRHCEIWCDGATWWVIDAGSTNGIRVESSRGVHRIRASTASEPAEPIELPPGALLVLSAHGHGAAEQYPRLACRAAQPQIEPEQPTAVVTPIAPPRPAGASLAVVARMASGTRQTEIVANALPFRIGRSRDQGLIVDRTHADVSGRHLEIVALDDSGATVVVLGDNGVAVGDTAYAPGAQFRWNVGEEMMLGRADRRAPSCTLVLSRS